MASISLELALPSSLMSVALTDPAGLTATLASIFSTTEPTWFANLPSQVQTYFESQFNAKFNTTFFTTVSTASATTTTNPSTQAAAVSSRLSADQAAGIGVGVGIGTILLIVGALLLYKRLATRRAGDRSSYFSSTSRRDQEKSAVQDDAVQRMSGYKTELPVPAGLPDEGEHDRAEPIELEAQPSSPHLSELEGTMRPLSELSSYQDMDSPVQGRFELGVYRSTRAAPS